MEMLVPWCRAAHRSARSLKILRVLLSVVNITHRKVASATTAHSAMYAALPAASSTTHASNTMTYPLVFVATLQPNPLSDNIKTWEHELRNDKDKEFILRGIHGGFHITDSAKFVKPNDVF